MIDPFLSRQIRLMSFAAMFSVVLMHSKNVLVGHIQNHYVIWLQELVCSTWTTWAVPFFFVLSGFFFANTKKFSYFSYIIKKIKTLLIPYLCWSMIGASIQLLTAIPNNHRMGYSLLENTILHFSSWHEICNALFGVVWYPAIGNGLVGPYGDRPLWYVRTLFIFFVFAPVFILLRRSKALSIILALFFIFFVPDYLIPCLYVKCGAIGFFLLGILIYEYQNKIDFSDTILIACGVGAIVLSFAFATQGSLMKYGERVFPFLVSGGLWYFLRHWQDRIPEYAFIRYSFWVYCMHSIFIGTLIGMGFLLLGKNNFAAILLLLITPWLVLSISLVAAMMLNKYSPKIFALLSGGRV